MCKYTCARVQREVIYRALHMMGSLGTTHLTPLLNMWTNAPTMSVMDGPDELHQVAVSRRVLRNYEPHEGNWPTLYLPRLVEEAKEKYASEISADPQLAEIAERTAMKYVPRAARATDTSY
jgi:hypothetical protein